jgi:dGTPase
MADSLEHHLALYAVCCGAGADRCHVEPEDPLRGPFEVDRHRIIECTSFRRLEGKTQVFARAYHDHFRTRLTHTLEAAQIARCLAVALSANEALAEVITLAHDLGHPPFGHAGEAALNEAMADAGGFNHNAHSLRIVEYLEHPFPAFRGLNLTAETCAGLATHATDYDVPVVVDKEAAGPTVESQIASWADRIAYDCHDLEDAIGAGFVGLPELGQVPAWRCALEKVEAQVEVRHVHAVRRVVLDTMLDAWLTDVIETSRQNLVAVTSLDQVRAADHALVEPSPEAAGQLTELEQFLLDRVYRHSDVAAMDTRGRNMILGLFEAYRASPKSLPQRFADRIDDQGLDRVICDYIAGMTDRFCEAEHERLV